MTIASLELHCVIRNGPSSTHVPTTDPQAAQFFGRRGRQFTKRRGFLPDPAIDPICLATLSVRHPTSTVDLFVLINCATLPGPRIDGPVDPKLYQSGLTSDYVQPGLDRKNQPRLLPRWIWCTDELTLLNWIIYIVQRFVFYGYFSEQSAHYVCTIVMTYCMVLNVTTIAAF